MSHDLPIDHATLRTLLQRDYGITARSLAYRAAEWSVGGFSITTEDGHRSYLKVQDAHPWTFAASSRDFYLPLIRELHRRAILRHISYPLPTQDGRLWTTHGPYALVLFNAIEGVTVGHQGMSDAVVSELAGLIGRLHTCAVHRRLSHPLIETFAVTFRDVLLSAISTDAGTGSGSDALREALRPRPEEIRAGLERLAALKRRLQQASPQMVVCHTDLHGDNLMRGSDGQLYILDWDNALVAPREHDLFFFAGDERFAQVFAPAYEAVAGPIRMSSDALRYYTYRRGLEDIADYVVRIARGDGDDDRDRRDLADVLKILDDLQEVEATVAAIEARGPAR